MPLKKHPEIRGLWIANSPLDFIGWENTNFAEVTPDGTKARFHLMRQSNHNVIRYVEAPIHIIPVSVLHYHPRKGK